MNFVSIPVLPPSASILLLCLPSQFLHLCMWGIFFLLGCFFGIFSLSWMLWNFKETCPGTGFFLFMFLDINYVVSSLESGAFHSLEFCSMISLIILFPPLLISVLSNGSTILDIRYPRLVFQFSYLLSPFESLFWPMFTDISSPFSIFFLRFTYLFEWVRESKKAWGVGDQGEKKKLKQTLRWTWSSTWTWSHNPRSQPGLKRSARH